MRKLSWTLIIAIYFCVISSAQKEVKRPYLVVFSFDGFRWDYPDSFPTPNFHFIFKYGVRAKSLIPVFPTVTFPNHYSIATGLYPDHHGIINNNFYASDLKMEYKFGNTQSVEDAKFYWGDPIWITAKKQNVRSAAYFWVGSEVPIEGLRPDFWKKYNDGSSFEQRIDTVIEWLKLADSLRPHLIMAYFNQPDHLTHSTGPFGKGVKDMIMKLDSLTGDFLVKLKQLPIHDQVNFIIVSDHGMEPVSDTKDIFLDNYFPKSWCQKIYGHTPMFTFDAKKGYADSIVLRLSKAEHLRVWKKQEIPSRLHFGTNVRINELVVLADSSYSLVWKGEKLDVAGNHGYDNTNTDMHGIFFAVGPVFKKGYLQPSFENVDIYLLMAHILKLNPAANDGDFSKIENMLK